MAPTSSSHLEHSTKTPCSSGIESLWVFSCLGYACTRSSVEEESDQFSTGIKLNVPDTVIFESGSPKFWLCTHDGKLTRRDLYQHLASYGDDGASQKHLKESLNDECISHAVEGMQSFWHRANSKATANSCIPACVVRVFLERFTQKQTKSALQWERCTPYPRHRAIPQFSRTWRGLSK